MDLIGIDLDAEKARVLEELRAFRDVCLPAFFAPGGIEPVWDDDLPLGGPDVANRPLHRWKEAVDRLAHILVESDALLDMLCGHGSGNLRRLDYRIRIITDAT